MTSITTTPSFVFGYWRPWKENSDPLDSYLNYAKDVSLAKYSADTVGKYINQASKEQVSAINELGHKIGMGMNVLSSQMSEVHSELNFLNRNIDLQIEQQKITNLLLENIAELLRVPDSEKERQHSIEMGLKFFVNAQKDEDLYKDALEELLKAEQLRKQDYFVLHRIGMIYLYASNHINPKKALDYFTMAAKYASVESDPKALRLANALTKNFETANSEVSSDTNAIQHLAADSYGKAAFAAYVTGDFELAVNNQNKALRSNTTPENYFYLAKYQARAGQVEQCVQNLDEAINKQPSMALAVFRELDLASQTEVLHLIEQKNQAIDLEIDRLVAEWKTLATVRSNEVLSELSKLKNQPYDTKIEKVNEYFSLASNIKSDLRRLQEYIRDLKKWFDNSFFPTYSEKDIASFKDQLDDALLKPYEVTVDIYNEIVVKYKSDVLKIGSKYAGGIVFYIDETGKHGLVCAEKDQGIASWGAGDLNSNPNNLSDAQWKALKERRLGTGTALGTGKTNTKIIVEQASWDKSLLSLIRKPAPTAARICAELSLNGYKDWFLPSLDELKLMYQNLYRYKDSGLDGGCRWSSSEDDSNGLNAYVVWADKQGNPSVHLAEKWFFNVHEVRAVRAF